MKFSRFEVNTSKIKPLAKFVSSRMDKSYSNATDDMIIIASETYKFRTNSTQMNMIVVKKNDKRCYVDIIGAAGGTGIFNFSLWAESGFVKGAYKLLQEYCSNQGLKLDEVKNM